MARRPRVVIVEGLLARAGPNYLLRTALSARLLAERLDAEPLVIFAEHPSSTGAARALYGSFGFSRFFHMRGRLADGRIAAWRDALRFVTRRPSLDDLLEFDVDGVVVGDLLYDDLLRKRQPRPLSSVDASCAADVAAASRVVRGYSGCVAAHDVVAAVVSHGAYVAYGGLARACSAAGVDVYETTDAYVTRFARNQTPCYQEGLRNLIERALPTLGDDAVVAARAALDARFNGTPEQIDVQLAYRGKRRYQRDELRARLGIDDRRPLVFALAHVLVDSPHICARMVYRDYEHWLRETLAQARHADAHFIVKPHPSSALYGEAGRVEAIAREHGAKICPDDFSTASIVDVADAVLTVQGTAGLEFACVGVPVVTAARAFYAGFGFTHDPTTRDEHLALVRRAGALPRLDEAQQVQALKVFRAFGLSSTASGLITPDLLSRIWGYGTPKDVDGAFADVGAALHNIDPRSDPTWLRLAALLEGAVA